MQISSLFLFHPHPQEFNCRTILASQYTGDPSLPMSIFYILLEPTVNARLVLEGRPSRIVTGFPRRRIPLLTSNSPFLGDAYSYSWHLSQKSLRSVDLLSGIYLSTIYFQGHATYRLTGPFPSLSSLLVHLPIRPIRNLAVTKQNLPELTGALNRFGSRRMTDSKNRDQSKVEIAHSVSPREMSPRGSFTISWFCRIGSAYHPQP
ncbi:hypothetical protein F5X96DRAFT_221646 [Biscogniauxia mediterranea]|nr:hypothetical protein F5X96DRAFT_221646 [Biscogniauxia mediterranea]